MSGWECRQSAFTALPRTAVWAYWTDLSNHARLEPGIERIELDGPFATGTTGRTVAAGFAQEWELADVREGRRFSITGVTPDGRGTLSFSWTFEDEGDGTRITYCIRAEGPQVEEHRDVFRAMETRAPQALDELVRTLDGIGQTS